MLVNKLKLNAAKAEFMVIANWHDQLVVERIRPVLKVADAFIHPKKIVRNLGILFHSEMSMLPATYRPYWQESRERLYERWPVLDRLSLLDYAKSLLVGTPESSLRSCQVVQNDAARMLARVSTRQHISPVLQNTLATYQATNLL